MSKKKKKKVQSTQGFSDLPYASSSRVAIYVSDCILSTVRYICLIVIYDSLNLNNETNSLTRALFFPIAGKINQFSYSRLRKYRTLTFITDPGMFTSLWTPLGRQDVHLSIHATVF